MYGASEKWNTNILAGLKYKFDMQTWRLPKKLKQNKYFMIYCFYFDLINIRLTKKLDLFG